MENDSYIFVFSSGKKERNMNWFKKNSCNFFKHVEAWLEGSKTCIKCYFPVLMSTTRTNRS